MHLTTAALLSRGKERYSRVKAALERDIQTIPIKSIYYDVRALYLACVRGISSVATHFILKCIGTYIYTEKSVISRL
jgi:short subunit dehydrogenase-like uncharacterized protein